MIHNLFVNILIKNKLFRDSTRYDYLLKSLELINKPYTELKQKELQEQQLEVIVLSGFFIINNNIK